MFYSSDKFVSVVKLFNFYTTMYSPSSAAMFKTITKYFLKLFQSYRVRLYILFSLVVLTRSIIVYYYIPLKSEHSALNALNNNAHLIAEISAYNAAKPLYDHDIKTLREVFRAIPKDSVIQFFILTDRNDSMLVGFNKEEAVAHHFRDATSSGTVSIDGTALLVKQNITLDSLFLGRVFIGLSLDALQAEVTESRKNALVIGAVIMIVGLTVLYMLGYLINRPAITLAIAFQRIAKGDYSNRVADIGVKEIDTLAASFNQMADSVEKAQ